MIEFIIIVESSADARTATKLAERVLIDKIDWLESEQIQYIFRWSGLQAGTEYSCWKNIMEIIEYAKQELNYRPVKYLGHGNGIPLKADGAASIKILNLVRFLQKTRRIRVVIFIRDLDNQPERKEGIEQARLQDINKHPKLEIIIGVANPKREAWVLNGFISSNQQEEQILEEIKTQLNFNPCIESYRLRSTDFEEPNRIRNPKVVVEQLTGGDMEREQQCWEDTNLEVLYKRGVDTGLTAYIQEVEEYLIPIIGT